MRRGLMAAVAGVLVAAVLVVPAGAEDGVTTVTASAAGGVAGSSVPVTGSVVFGTDRVQVSEDPAGDAGGAQTALGMDIVAGYITNDPARPRDLLFEVEVSQMPPTGGVPEAAIFGWNLLVDDQAPGNYSSANLEWRRTNVTGASLAAPFIAMRSCVPNPQTGGSTCSAAPLTGAIDPATRILSATQRITVLGAVQGSKLGSSGVSVYHGTGQLWFPGIMTDQASVEEYEVPGRDDSVRLAVVRPGFPVTTWTAAATPTGAAATGSYAVEVPTTGLVAGSYEVVARACWGTNCGETRTPITLS